jgi:hypothetical protein
MDATHAFASKVEVFSGSLPVHVFETLSSNNSHISVVLLENNEFGEWIVEDSCTSDASVFREFNSLAITSFRTD